MQKLLEHMLICDRIPNHQNMFEVKDLYFICLRLKIYISFTGSDHRIVPLDKLALTLIEKINEKKVWVFDKEEGLLEVEKTLTKTLSEFDNKTEEMVEKLHQARDTQVGEVVL